MVRRDLHGQGYGQALTSYRLSVIKTKYPHSTIKIDTSQYSKGFYEKQGFVPQAFEKYGYAPGLDKYVMTCTTPSTS
jgi:predicted GNAT family N-acyltransferase